MRLGGPFNANGADPETWAKHACALGYSAVLCPVNDANDEKRVKTFSESAKRNDIVIAEVGAWSNPLSTDEDIRKKALQKCKEKLHLADLIDARCCVNVAGSVSETGKSQPRPENYGKGVHDLLVESIREIIDSVQPKRSFYTVEMMPWIEPDSPESYLKLLQDVDRKQFGVHLDPVNLVNSVQRYYHTADLVKACISCLGPYIKSCHIKDCRIQPLNLPSLIHVMECAPGTGEFDCRTYVRELHRLDAQMPLLMEHLKGPEAYRKAAEYIRSIKLN